MKPKGRLSLRVMGGLGGILLAAALYWAFSNFERRSLDIDTGYSAAARRNPFLAAERFLARLNIPVEGLAGRDLLRDLPPPGDTLVVNGLGVLNEERQKTLQQWIERGGRLIVEAVSLWDESDLLRQRRDDFLDGYGVRLLEYEGSGDSSAPDEEVVAKVSIHDYPYQLEVGFAPAFYLEDASGEARSHVAADERVHVLQYAIGNGLLTVTSDNRFLTNSQIGRHDHARFVALLANPPKSGKVWLLYDSSIPWLGALLWRNAPFAIVSSLCLLTLALWYLGGRLGPFLPTPAANQRDLLAHLQASAGFLWRHGQANRLTNVSRERIEQAWLRHHPSLRELEQAERAAWMARRTDTAPGDVRRALYSAVASERELVANTVLLQRLWSSLSISGSATQARRTGASAIRRIA